MEQKGLTQGTGQNQPRGTRKYQCGRRKGWVHRENAYGLGLETTTPLLPAKELSMSRISFASPTQITLSHPFVRQSLLSTYHISQTLGWAWGTWQCPGKMKPFSTWSLESSRGDRQVTGDFYQKSELKMGKQKDLRVQGKRPDQLEIGFLHLARLDWNKGGKTLPSRGNRHKSSEERSRILMCFSLLRGWHGKE